MSSKLTGEERTQQDAASESITYSKRKPRAGVHLRSQRLCAVSCTRLRQLGSNMPDRCCSRSSHVSPSSALTRAEASLARHNPKRSKHLHRCGARLECSKSTLHRAIATLKNHLAPVVFDTNVGGYKYDRAHGEAYELPGLWFSAYELQALAIMQRLLNDAGGGLLGGALGPARETTRRAHALGDELRRAAAQYSRRLADRNEA